MVLDEDKLKEAADEYACMYSRSIQYAINPKATIATAFRAGARYAAELSDQEVKTAIEEFRAANPELLELHAAIKEKSDCFGREFDPRCVHTCKLSYFCYKKLWS